MNHPTPWISTCSRISFILLPYVFAAQIQNLFVHVVRRIKPDRAVSMAPARGLYAVTPGDPTHSGNRSRERRWIFPELRPFAVFTGVFGAVIASFSCQFVDPPTF